MREADRALWQRIRMYSPDDPGSPLRFTDRLARENGWHPVFARRVFDEYLRFMFLAATSGHPVTPSDQVDQVWHLHLTYTREYWDEFCGKVLGRPVHHGPTRGGRSEGVKFDAWYERTLECYELTFGERPPEDVWPPSTIRFGEDLAYRRVNVARSWVIRKPDWVRRMAARAPRPLRTRFAAAGILGVPTAAALAAKPLDWYGPRFLMLFGGVFVISVLLAVAIRHVYHPQPRPVRGSLEELSPEEAAFVEGGPGRVLQTTLGSLMYDRVVEVRRQPSGKSPRFRSGTPSDRSLTPLEERAVAVLKATPDGMDLTELKAALSADLLQLESDLLTRGLVLSRGETLRVRLASATPLALTLALGLLKMNVGVARDRPVGYLFLGCLTVVLVAAWLVRNFPRASREAHRRLAELKRVRRRQSTAEPVTRWTVDDMAWTVALDGLSAVYLRPDQKEALGQPQRFTDGFASGGCGSGNGGGGGGDGGCGGCGGCGD